MLITILAILGALVLVRLLGLDRLAALACVAATIAFVLFAPRETVGIVLGAIAVICLVPVMVILYMLPDFVTATWESLRAAWRRRQQRKHGVT